MDSLILSILCMVIVVVIVVGIVLIALTVPCMLNCTANQISPWGTIKNWTEQNRTVSVLNWDCCSKCKGPETNKLSCFCCNPNLVNMFPFVISPQCRSSVEHAGWTAIPRQTRATSSPYLSYWKHSLVKSAETRWASKRRQQVEYLPNTLKTPFSRTLFVLSSNRFNAVFIILTFHNECFPLRFIAFQLWCQFRVRVHQRKPEE